ncbi:hypothetical protein bsdtb5_23910 [Anaeromicropila herbilytica]|uniref:Membrane protein YfhO n=1 Tax=Anaeromicropila herbilytica TaxID=2785025 RepID=A0A7R7EM11_9FIRM|nr:hypothetical protein bsdtb5_23910 [Anaeromicropila herbilytica]
MVLGALIYVFSGYTLYEGIRHPFFINSMIYLPLLLIGLEQVLRRKKPYLLVAMTFISTISNFYFFYIITVIAVLYVVIQYLFNYHQYFRNKIWGLIATGLRTGGYYLIGMLMGSFLFLPVVYAFSNNGRLESGPELLSGLLHYDKKYYLSIIQEFIAPGKIMEYCTQLSFISITVVGLVILVCNKTYRKLCLVFFLAFGGLLIPAVGYFMNGFSYVTNRWSFLISFLISFIFTVTYERMFELKVLEKILLVFVLLGYGVATFFFPSKGIVKYEFFVLLLVISLICILQIKWFVNKSWIREGMIFAIVLVTIGFHGYEFYSSHYYGYVSSFLTKKEVDEYTKKGALSLLSSTKKEELENPNTSKEDKLENDSFYRIETYGEMLQNEALCLDYYDVSGYYSLMNQDVTSYFKELELFSQRDAYRFDNLDNRAILDALSSVKYFATTNRGTVPYGFQLCQVKKVDTKNRYLYRNMYSLPLGYIYENYILEKDYKKLNALEKQNAMLDAVVLDNENDHVKKTKQDMSIGIEKVDTKITPDQNVNLSNHEVKIHKAGAKITLEYASKPNSETYIWLERFNIKPKIDAISTVRIVNDKKVIKTVKVRSKYYDSYFGKENYLCNIGVQSNNIDRKEDKSTITIKFPTKQTYTYQNLNVYRLDMSYFTSQIAQLKKSSLQNVEIQNNKIQGNVTLDKKGVMVLSIPYSKGWNAYVDHKKVKILHGNVMYMAIPLEAGNHDIVLRYETPYLKTGLIISAIDLITFILIMKYQKMKRKLIHITED